MPTFDVLFSIMSLVDLPTLAAMRLVCSQFAYVAAHESMWRRRVIADFSSIRNMLLGRVSDRPSRFAINYRAEVIDATITKLEAVRAELFKNDPQVVDASNDFKVTLIRLPGVPEVLKALGAGEYICVALPVPGRPLQGFALRHAIVMRKQKRDRDDLLFADVRYVGRDGHLHRAEAAEFLEGSYAMYLVSLRPSGADERAADRAQAWQGSIYSVRSENERVWTAASFCLFCRTGAYVHPDIFPLGRIDLPPRA